jgi:hypothetical protein
MQNRIIYTILLFLILSIVLEAKHHHHHHHKHHKHHHHKHHKHHKLHIHHKHHHHHKHHKKNKPKAPKTTPTTSHSLTHQNAPTTHQNTHTIQSHQHHAGIHHEKPHYVKHTTPGVVQSTKPVPLYSPPFVGLQDGQIPTDAQVDLIVDWLSKIGATIDVFLRLQGTFPDGSKEQRQLVKNVYPPLRVLLEAQYAYQFKTNAMH